MFSRLSTQIIQKSRRLIHQKTNVDEIRIPVPWGHIAAKWWGRQDERPILSLHGWQDNAGTFDKLAPLLCSHRPILAIDLPGHGFSSHLPPGYPYLLIDYIITLKYIQDYYKWEQMSLIGHSMGSLVSLWYAGTFPESVDTYTAIDAISTKHSHSNEKTLNILSKGLDKFIDIEKFEASQTPAYSYEKCMELFATGPRLNLKEEDLKSLMPRALTLRSDHKYSFSRDPRLKCDFSITSRELRNEMFKRLECHVLSILANPGLSLDTQEGYQETITILKSKCKSVTTEELEGHHFIHLTEPEKVASLILKFLKNSAN